MNGFLLIPMVLTGIALVWAVLLTIQTHEHRRFARAALGALPRKWHVPPAALVCVPCKGLDLDLVENLRCMLEQDYPAYRVRFVVDAEDDPACAVIEQLIRESAVPCELLVAGTCTDSGQKVHNLCYATAELPDDIAVLVFFDSDARPARNALSRLVNCACRGGLQVATGYRWFVPKRVTLPNLTLASINAAVAGLMKHHGWNLVWGGSWAITRELFEKTELARAWRGTLSDDLVASRVLRRAGARIAFEPGCMAASPIDVTWRETASFLRRQFVIGRCYAPAWWWGTIPLMVLQPLVFFGGLAWAAVIALRGEPSWYWPLMAAGTLYALTVVRSFLRHAVWSQHLQRDRDTLRATARFDHWAAPLSCLFAAGAMLASAVGRSITWRGIHYHIGTAGRITLLGRVPDEHQRREILAANAQRLEQDKVARLQTAEIEIGGHTCTFVCGIHNRGLSQKISPAGSAWECSPAAEICGSG